MIEQNFQALTYINLQTNRLLRRLTGAFMTLVTVFYQHTLRDKLGVKRLSVLCGSVSFEME